MQHTAAFRTPSLHISSVVQDVGEKGFTHFNIPALPLFSQLGLLQLRLTEVNLGSKDYSLED